MTSELHAAPLTPLHAAATQVTPPRQRLTVYTVLVGAKEPLNDPLSQLPPIARQTDLELDFVCFTDNPAQHSPTWRMQALPPSHLPVEKFSRRPKALPHEYLPDCDHSLYIDNTVTLRRLPQAADLATPHPYLLRAFRHPLRNALTQEADAVATMGYDDVDTICRQLDFYAGSMALDAIQPLSTATVILRSHHDATVKRFGTLWWDNLLAFSKRDQLSMDFARLHSGAEVDYWPGSLDDNSFVQRNDGAGTLRVRASFDPARYAWLHRDDPAAQRDPRAHFLAHDGGPGHRYQRPLRLLEYICARQHSSLGQRVSPRRGMADALQALLMPLRGRRFLLVRVQGGSGERSFSADELHAASGAIAAFMGGANAGTALDIPATQLAADGTVYGAPPQPFDVLVVLGLAPELLASAAQKLARLLVPQRSALVLALSSPALLAAVVRAEQLLADVLCAPLRTALHGSQHDAAVGLVDNTVLGFICQPPAEGAATP